MSLKNLKTFAQEVGLTYNSKRLLAYGKYHGYDTIIKNAAQQKLFIITMNIGMESPEQEQAISQYLLSLSQTKPYVKFASFDDNTISISVKFKMKNNLQNIREVLDAVTRYCRTNGMVSCCKYCGSQTNLSMFSINSQYATMCNDCFEKAQADLSMAQLENNQRKSNVIAGIVGSLLGSLIGVVLWVIVYQLGYIAGIAGLVMAVCSMKGYEKFGGKLNIVGVIISLVVAIAMLYFAENIAVALEIFNEFKKEYAITFFDAFRLIPSLLQEEASFRGAFIGDLVIGYILMLVASGSTIISTYKNSNLMHEMTRLD
ncbi:hypothetical protein [Aminipila sp.]|uniref:hypothetical protein n=1 Tax=Aminipila sp. TaxID=2060095 RepID=UPI002898B414|nr:hypothetical protein [Aminipila sp.]